MQISVTLPSMTAAPSNVKNREIHKGGIPYDFSRFYRETDLFDFTGNGDGRQCQIQTVKLDIDKPDILSYYQADISIRHRDNL